MRCPVGFGYTLACLLVLVAGCSATADPPPAPEPWPAPPAGTALARVQPGMTQHEVMEILGTPREITNRSTITSLPATGETRTYYVYPGLGEVIFSAAAGGATSALGVYYLPGP